MAALVVGLALPAAVMADPPPHAPAHGWRKKNDPYYVGYTGRQWTTTTASAAAAVTGTAPATALGAVAGGAIGAEVASEDNTLIAILAGAAIGAVIGHEIGKEMDDDDRAASAIRSNCSRTATGQLGRRRSGMLYRLTPTGRFERDGRVCRRFTLVRDYGGKQSRSRPAPAATAKASGR